MLMTKTPPRRRTTCEPGALFSDFSELRTFIGVSLRSRGPANGTEPGLETGARDLPPGSSPGGFGVVEQALLEGAGDLVPAVVESGDDDPGDRPRGAAAAHRSDTELTAGRHLSSYCESLSLTPASAADIPRALRPSHDHQELARS